LEKKKIVMEDRIQDQKKEEEEEAQKKIEEENQKKKEEEDTQKKKEEESLKKIEEDQKKKEEDRKKKESDPREQAKRMQEESKRMKEEADKLMAEEEQKKYDIVEETLKKLQSNNLYEETISRCWHLFRLKSRDPIYINQKKIDDYDKAILKLKNGILKYLSLGEYVSASTRKSNQSYTLIAICYLHPEDKKRDRLVGIFGDNSLDSSFYSAELNRITGLEEKNQLFSVDKLPSLILKYTPTETISDRLKDRKSSPRKKKTEESYSEPEEKSEDKPKEKSTGKPKQKTKEKTKEKPKSEEKSKKKSKKSTKKSKDKSNSSSEEYKHNSKNKKKIAQTVVNQLKRDAEEARIEIEVERRLKMKLGEMEKTKEEKKQDNISSESPHGPNFNTEHLGNLHELNFGNHTSTRSKDEIVRAMCVKTLINQKHLTNQYQLEMQSYNADNEKLIDFLLHNK